MKRNYPAKRRDRRANLSTYCRNKKQPAQYSAAYYEWRRGVAMNAAKGEERHAQRQLYDTGRAKERRTYND